MFPALSCCLRAKKHHALLFLACAMEVEETVGTGQLKGGSPLSHFLQLRKLIKINKKSIQSVA